MEHGRYWILADINEGISLVLSGGAARGAFHLGVLHALDEANIPIKAMSGSSIGAVVGAGYLSGNSPKKLLELFKSKAFKQALKLNLLHGSLLRLDANAPIMNHIINDLTRLESLSPSLHVSVTDLENGCVLYLKEGDLKELLLATSALVPLFGAQKVANTWMADGGIIDNFPIAPLLPLGFPILGVNLHPNVPLQKHGVLQHLARAIFLGWHSGVARNITQCDYYLSPKKLGEFSILRFAHLDEMFALGVKETHALISKIKA